MRTPFRPVRFAGETPIVSRLEAGPVEVVNLIGDRAMVRIDLAGAAKPARRIACGAGHAHRLLPRRSGGACGLHGEAHRLPADQAASGSRTSTAATCIAGTDGVLLLGSVICV